MITPALVIDGKVRVSGKLPSESEITEPCPLPSSAEGGDLTNLDSTNQDSTNQDSTHQDSTNQDMTHQESTKQDSKCGGLILTCTEHSEESDPEYEPLTIDFDPPSGEFKEPDHDTLEIKEEPFTNDGDACPNEPGLAASKPIFKTGKRSFIKTDPDGSASYFQSVYKYKLTGGSLVEEGSGENSVEETAATVDSEVRFLFTPLVEVRIILLGGTSCDGPASHPGGVVLLVA